MFVTGNKKYHKLRPKKTFKFLFSWLHLITETAQINRNFTLDCSFWFQVVFKEFKKYNYRQLMLEKNYNVNVRHDPDQIFEMVKYKKENLKEAKVSCLNWSFVSKVLKELTNLEKLELVGVSSDLSDETPAERILLTNLKELKLQASGQYIDAPNLKKFKFHGAGFPRKFLNNCQNLTHFTYETVRYQFGSADTIPVINEIPQHLVSLEVILHINASLIPLLESQKNTLRELKLFGERCGEVDFAVYEMKLEKLEINLSDLSDAPKNFKSTIKDLTLNYASDSECLEKLFKICPQVVKLTLRTDPSMNQAAVQLASFFLNNLKHLIIYDALEIIEGWPNMNHFIRLETLEFKAYTTIGCADSLTACIKLVDHCPYLKKLDINRDFHHHDEAPNESFLSGDFTKFLCDLQALEELSINFGFLLTHGVIKTLMRSNISIFNLTVSEDSFERQQKLAVKLSKKSNIRCTVYKREKIR